MMRTLLANQGSFIVEEANTKVTLSPGFSISSWEGPERETRVGLDLRCMLGGESVVLQVDAFPNGIKLESLMR